MNILNFIFEEKIGVQTFLLFIWPSPLIKYISELTMHNSFKNLLEICNIVNSEKKAALIFQNLT